MKCSAAHRVDSVSTTTTTMASTMTSLLQTTSSTPAVGLIVTGGDSNSDTLDVEFIDVNSNRSCYLPPLPDYRWGHSQDGLLTCGGGSSYNNTCLEFSDGQWSMTHHLTYSRRFHGSWKTSEGLMLVGSYTGHDQDNTTEILTDDGCSEEVFSIQHRKVSDNNVEVELK